MKTLLCRTQLALLPLLLIALAGCRPDYPKCKNDSHCAEHGEVCVEGLCKECSSDAQCKEGFRCKDNACVALPQCRLDADCTGGLRCRGEKCVPECTSDRECATGEKCQAQKCVPAAECVSDGDCGSGKKCGTEGKCVTAEAADAGTGEDTPEAKRLKFIQTCTLERVQFDFNEFALSDQARATLDRNADCIKGKLEKGLQKGVTIEGHADERGTEEYNIVLAEKRANAVKRYVAGLGVDENALKTVGYGEEKPLDPGHNEEAWAKNRRAEFLFR